MREDGLSQKRRQEFLVAGQKKSKTSRDLDDDIVFLAAVQKIKPFRRQRMITASDRNIL